MTEPVLHRRVAFSAMVVAVCAYALVFSYLTIMEHRVFWTWCYDLGNMDQAVWNTAHGRLLELTTVSGIQSRLGLHVEPILILIAPLYWVYESVNVLLIVQSVIVALGGVFVYLLARRRLRNSFAALGLTAVYLMYPPLQAANVFHFHAVTLSSTFVLAALYAIEVEHFGMHYLFSALAMSCKEDGPLIVVALGLYLIISKKKRKHGSATVVFGLVWFSVASFVILPAFNHGDLAHFDRYSQFGDGLADAIVYIATHPFSVARYLATEQRFMYVISLFAPLAFLPLFGLGPLMLSLPTLAVNLLSNFPYQHLVDEFHYSAPAVAGLLGGTIAGIDWLATVLSGAFRLKRRTWVGILSLMVFASGCFSCYRRGALPIFGGFDWPTAGYHESQGQRQLEAIPADASVSAQTSLVPHLTHRREVYQYPVVDDAEYIVFDVTSGSVWPLDSYERYRADVDDLIRHDDFGVWSASDGFLVLRRGFLSDTIPDQFYSFVTPEMIDPEYHVNVEYGDTVELVGYDVAMRRHGRMRLSVYLAPRVQGFGGVEVLAVFMDEDGHTLGIRPFLTSEWLSPSLWARSDVIKLDTGYMSGLPRTKFSIGLWLIGHQPTSATQPYWDDSGRRSELRLSADGQQLSLRDYAPRGLEIIDVTPSASTNLPLGVVRTDVQFADGATLIGYKWDRGRSSAVDGPTLRLHWRTDNGFSEDYTVFVHLVNPNDVLIAQHDKPPLEGRYPTSWWHPGETVTDDFHLTLPDKPAPGERRICVGMYLPESGERLPLSGSGVLPDRRACLDAARHWQLTLP